MESTNGEPCPCKRGEQVKYVCLKSDCPNHTTNSEYCIKCALDNQLHLHRNIEIRTNKYVTEVAQRWSKFALKSTQMFEKARETWKTFKKLVAYLDLIAKESDKLKPTKDIYQDYMKLSDLIKEISEKANDVEEKAKTWSEEEI